MHGWKMAGVAILVGVILLVVVLSTLPVGSGLLFAFERAIQWCFSAWVFIVILTVFTCLVYFVGFYSHKVLSNKGLSGFAHFTVAIVYALLAGVVQVVMLMFFLSISPQFHDLLAMFGGAGPFETAPIGWAVFGAVSYLLGYSWISLVTAGI